MKITLEYKRLREEVDGEYPYTGAFKIPGMGDIAFISWHFKKVIGKLSDLLNIYQDVNEVTLQRVDRAGILPMGFGPAMIKMLREDPLTAYRTLTFEQQQYRSADAAQQNLTSRSFGPVVYLRMKQGKVECPLTGQYRTLAYGDRYGWKIRGEGNAHEKWVPLVDLVDVSPEGTQGVQRLAFAIWARVSVQDLLDLGAPEYYLPRPWNRRPSGWIDREELESLLEHEGAEECQEQ